LLVVPVPTALDLSALSTVAALAPVLLDRYRPAVPTTSLAAIDVPDIVVVPPPFRVARIDALGAQRSTQLP
jgi:hypothetical protein